MLKLLARVWPHISTAVTVLGIVGAAGMWAANTWAEDVVKGLVDQRILNLEGSVNSLKTQDAIQSLQLKGIQDSQSDIKESQREINRDIKAILRKLSEN